MPGLSRIASRWMNSLLITGLSSNTIYSFTIIYPNKPSITIKYKTIPDISLSTNPNDKLVMINGGDVGNTDKSMSMTKSLAKNKPDILVLGGDLAYSNNMRGCYATWDLYLDMFKDKLFTDLGYQIPVIHTIGNHEYGGKAL